MNSEHDGWNKVEIFLYYVILRRQIKFTGVDQSHSYVWTVIIIMEIDSRANWYRWTRTLPWEIPNILYIKYILIIITHEHWTFIWNHILWPLKKINTPVIIKLIIHIQWNWNVLKYRNKCLKKC